MGLRRQLQRNPPPPPRGGGADGVRVVPRIDERHQAAPGLVHGGLVAAALDEACGLLATWYRFPVVTGRLFVDFRRPVPINTELLVRARLEREHGRDVHVSGELVDGDDVLAGARCAFVHVPLEHFLQTPEGRAAAAKWRDRLAAGDN